jgi:drug/metabolite transporter (DMT)-like permease
MISVRHKAYLYLIAVSAIWGAAAPVIKYTLEGIDPLPFLAYRFFIASILSIIIFGYKIYKGKKFRQFKANFNMVIVYGFLAVPFALGVLFFGLDKTTVLDLTLVGVIGPMIVTAGAAVFFRDRITKRERIGIAILLIGVIFNSLFPIIKNNDVRLTGNLMLLLYLLADSSSILIAKKAVRKKMKSVNLTNFAFIIGAIVFIPAAIFQYGFTGTATMITTLPLKYHLGVWYMAILSGNLAYYLYVRGQRSIEVSEAVLFNYLQPIFTIPLAVLWLGEELTPHFIFGALLIALGLYVAEKKHKTKIQP